MSGKLITPDDFAAWQRGNAALLHDALAENQARVDDSVIRAIMQALTQRVSLEQAGDTVLATFLGTRSGVCFTRAGIMRSLRAIGWTPPAKRRGSAHE